MKLNWKDWPIGPRLVAAQALVSFVLFGLVLAGVYAAASSWLSKRSISEIENLNARVVDMVATYDTSLRQAATRLTASFSKEFSGPFSIDAKKTTKIGEVEAPVIKSGEKPLNLDFTEVDRFASVANGANATVFVRIGDDFFRVATSVKKENGDRATGTYLGKGHPAYASMLEGKEWIGKLKLFGRDFMTGYRPVMDASGKVVGILYIGLDFADGIKALGDRIKTIKVGKTGYVTVIDNSTATRGEFVVHPAAQGKNMLASKDASGREIIKEMLDQGKGTMFYPWMNAALGETAPREKVGVLATYEPWKWLINSSTYVEEFTAEAWQLTLAIAGAAGVVLLLLNVMTYFALRAWISRPLGRAVDIANGLAKGDLSAEFPAATQDEAGRLLEAMRGMATTLKDFSAAQAEIARQHEAGYISYRIDASKFSGAYRDIAADVNELVAAHIAVKMKVVDIIGEYAKGDLTRDMEQLPAEKARITDAMNAVKAGMQAINGEILKLTTAASKGDFTARGDEARFENDFRKMIASLNGLMEVADRGLTDVSRSLEALARGDLTSRIKTDYEGTFGDLKDNSNETASQLGQIVAQIRESAESISTASGEIAQGNTDLSSRTEQQASSLQETASSMEELTSTVKQNAENAKQANQLAESASDVATQGGQVVSQVVETMGAISESAKKIADIITVIDGIAFQTNILALNAAVEAARAGEQGRGFAVVATEVRNLAQRSANAAKEIKDLIGNSVEKVETGSKLVANAGQTMDEVVKSVKRVADIISEITAASAEQSAGIEQVNQAITQMDQVTQQNAALVEQAAAAAQSMREQANGLTQAVSVFRLGTH